MTDPSDSIERSVESITSSWIELVRQGDNDAWKQLEKLYRGLVCWWCGKSGIPPQDIDDLVQEVFLGVAKAMRSYEHQTFRGFLWSVTRNKIQDYWRDRNKRAAAWGGSTLEEVLANVEAESASRIGSVDVATKIIFDAIVELVQSEFSATDWQAFWRVTVEGMPAAEVASLLGITRNQVYLAKSRILRRIRAEFDGTMKNVPFDSGGSR